ncbi:hypothetical protein GCM10009848_05220 [Micromonospora lupini]
MAFCGVLVSTATGPPAGTEVAGAYLGDDIGPRGRLDVTRCATGGEDDRTGGLDDLLEVAQGLVPIGPAEMNSRLGCFGMGTFSLSVRMLGFKRVVVGVEQRGPEGPILACQTDGCPSMLTMSARMP